MVAKRGEIHNRKSINSKYSSESFFKIQILNFFLRKSIFFSKNVSDTILLSKSTILSNFCFTHFWLRGLHLHQPFCDTPFLRLFYSNVRWRGCILNRDKSVWSKSCSKWSINWDGIGNIFWKNYLADFLRKKLKIWFFKKIPTKIFNFSIFCYGFPLLCNHANLGHETWKKSYNCCSTLWYIKSSGSQLFKLR